MKHPAARFTSLALLLTLMVVLSSPPLHAAAGKVNINTASIDELQYLPRVGPVVAQRILDYREKNERFKSTEELMLVQGIGEKTFEQIAPYITVSGETTLKEKVRLSSGDEA